MIEQGVDMTKPVRREPTKGRPNKEDSRQSITPMELVQKIDGLIESGSLIPGQRLIESDLMAEFSASRGIVREALRFLAGDGVVEILPNKGVRITKFDRERIVDMVQVYWGLFRTAIELLVSRPLPEEAIAALKTSLDATLAAAKVRNKALIIEGLADYHEIVVRYSGNEYLPTLLKKMHYRHYVKQEGLQTDIEIMLDTCTTYTEIHKNILARDVDTVAKLAAQVSVAWLGGLRQETA